MELDYLRYETIGYGSYMEGPYGKRLMTYADYTASGRNLRFLENYYLQLSETYANTHTEDDYTGRCTTLTYRDALLKIRQHVGAAEDYLVFPTGTGATGAIDKLIKILGLYKTPEYWRRREAFLNQLPAGHKKHMIEAYEKDFAKQQPVIFISAYEHHSNEVQWRESHGEVVKVNLNDEGLFDLDDLRAKVSLEAYKDRMKIGSFSAASNVTGIKSPVREIAKIMHEHGGYAFFDYAACAPYVEIKMEQDEEDYLDGIYLSMHKFLGGVGASGILIMNRALYNTYNAPCSTGGGTVHYVTHDDHKYLRDPQERENAGTPGIMQVIRAAMALELKATIGVNHIRSIEYSYIKRAINTLELEDYVEILGNLNPHNRIAILSFNIKYEKGYLHHRFVSVLLNDLFGIQSRSGCVCAGPYGICLLGIDDAQVERFKEALDAEINVMKPGWTRVNFHYTMDRDTVDYILDAIKFIAKYGHEFLQEYQFDCIHGHWKHKHIEEQGNIGLSLLQALLLKRKSMKTKKKKYHHLYKKYIDMAYKIRKNITCQQEKHTLFGTKYFPDIAWFYHAEEQLEAIDHVKI